MIANTTAVPTTATLIDWNLISTTSTTPSTQPPIFGNASAVSSAAVAAFSSLLYTPNSVEFILNGTVPTIGTASVPTATSTSVSISAAGGNNSYDHNGDDSSTYTYPAYMRTTSMVFCIAIMCLGVIGNVMVPIVIFKTKDMRNSTNIFLVNLSVADLMVLLVCTPTVLVEVNAKPEVWVLGEEMCKAVPFVELTVAHASVLTILAISFERYYAICKPLKAGYICTKARASLICLLAWIIAAIFTSPMLAITKYSIEEYYDGTLITACFSQVDTFLPALFFILSITIFFFVPLAILIILYALIAKALMNHPNMMAPYKLTHCHIPAQSVIKYRKQVVLMLGTVVLAFFICLLPFRALVLWIIVVPADSILKYGLEGYWNILYFCRIMFHINSAINPILYNIMSSKFRGGFFRLCGLRRLHAKYRHNADINRKNTFNTTSSLQNSSQQTSESFWNRYSSHNKHHRHHSSDKEAKDEARNNKEKSLRECYVRIPPRTVEGVRTTTGVLMNGESYV